MVGKPDLRPPSQPRNFAQSPNATRYKVIALIGFAILAIGAIAVVVVLPRQVENGKTEKGKLTSGEASDVRLAGDQPPDDIASSDSSQTNESLKVKAETILQKVLKRQTQLESENAQIWGAEKRETSYGEAMSELTHANQQMDKRSFEEAAEAYEATLETFERLASSKSKRIEAALQSGNQALDTFESQEAMRQFKIALAGDPRNAAALSGMERAKRLPQALALLERGKVEEAADRLGEAKRFYQSALELDGALLDATQRLERIDALITQRDFERAMSKGFAALEKGDLQAAQAALEAAKGAEPGAVAVKELESQIARQRKLNEIQRLRAAAENAVAAEQWRGALQHYNSILSIDSSAVFAQSAKLRAEKNIGLIDRVRDYLDAPEKLESNEGRDRAGELLELARDRPDIGRNFARMTQELESLLAAYNTPSPVFLISDGKTDVRVYRVGQLGSFRERRLELKPGKYRVQGIRSGYRDVNESFTIPVGSKTEIRLTVLCKEEI